MKILTTLLANKRIKTQKRPKLMSKSLRSPQKKKSKKIRISSKRAKKKSKSGCQK